MRGTLRRLKTDTEGHRLRTSEVVGDYVVEPTVGKSFVLIGAPLDLEKNPDANMRLIQTSPVVKILGIHMDPTGASKATKLMFATENTLYELETV